MSTAETRNMTVATAAPWAKSWLRKVVSNMKIEGRSLASAGPPLGEHEDEVEHLQRRVAQQHDGAGGDGPHAAAGRCAR